jgi:hypothetical protein
MLLESTKTTGSSTISADDSTAAEPTAAAVAHPVAHSVRDDVERLIQIAAQLFSAIERQIHSIESDLMFTQGEEARLRGQTVFKEQLIRSAISLDASLRDIVLHLGEWADATNERARGRQNSFAE